MPEFGHCLFRLEDSAPNWENSLSSLYKTVSVTKFLFWCPEVADFLDEIIEFGSLWSNLNGSANVIYIIEKV